MPNWYIGVVSLSIEILFTYSAVLLGSVVSCQVGNSQFSGVLELPQLLHSPSASLWFCPRKIYLSSAWVVQRYPSAELQGVAVVCKIQLLEVVCVCELFLFCVHSAILQGDSAAFDIPDATMTVTVSQSVTVNKAKFSILDREQGVSTKDLE